MRRSEIRQLLKNIIDDMHGQESDYLTIPVVADKEVPQIEQAIKEIQRRYNETAEANSAKITNNVVIIDTFSPSFNQFNLDIEKLEQIQKAYNKVAAPTIMLIINYLHEITFNQLELAIEDHHADLRFKTAPYPKAIKICIKTADLDLLKRALLIHSIAKELQALEDKLDDLEQKLRFTQKNSTEKIFALNQYKSLTHQTLPATVGLPLFLSFREYLNTPKSLFFKRCETVEPSYIGSNYAENISTRPFNSLTQHEVIEIKKRLLNQVIAWKESEVLVARIDGVKAQANYSAETLRTERYRHGP